MKITVIGAGNGGQAIAGYLGIKGYHVTLYDRNPKKVEQLCYLGGIKLQGQIEGFGKIDEFTSEIGKAVSEADVVMITTIANAHQELAEKMSPHIKEGQVIILNPGRTCGALVFNQALKRTGCNIRYYLAEAQTLVYACRIIGNGIVNIIGVKDEVLL